MEKGIIMADDRCNNWIVCDLSVAIFIDWGCI